MHERHRGAPEGHVPPSLAERPAIRALDQCDPGCRIIAHCGGLLLRPRRARAAMYQAVRQVTVWGTTWWAFVE
jgi:hypothetical protein